MSDTSQGPGWWQASDGKWYAPEQHPGYRPAPSGYYGTGPANTGIEIVAKHNPLAWLFYFTKLDIAVDGQHRKSAWGKNVISAKPGHHRVEISFGYLGRQRGAASAEVTVPQVGAVRVNYKMPSWMFAPGRLTVSP